MRKSWLGFALALVGLLVALPAEHGFAQTPPAFTIAILNEERLLRESQLGQSILAALGEAERALEEENRRIAEALAAEERALTTLRGQLSAEEFRARAEAFDHRVEEIRAERARLAQELAERYEAETRRFFEQALPIIAEMARNEGVALILRPEAVILNADWLDLTDRVIERLDREFGRAPSANPEAPVAEESSGARQED